MTHTILMKIQHNLHVYYKIFFEKNVVLGGIRKAKAAKHIRALVPSHIKTCITLHFHESRMRHLGE